MYESNHRGQATDIAKSKAGQQYQHGIVCNSSPSMISPIRIKVAAWRSRDHLKTMFVYHAEQPATLSGHRDGHVISTVGHRLLFFG